MLPYCIINDIIDYLPIDDKILITITLNKNFHTSAINIWDKIIKIQNFYKNNLPRLPSSEHYNNNYENTFSKHLLVRYYVCNYDLQYFRRYPEFLLNKCINENSNKFNEVNNWINQNLSSDLSKRTIRQLRDFLMHPLITKKDILRAGW